MAESFILGAFCGAAVLWLIQDFMMALMTCQIAEKPLWKWYRGRVRGLFSDKPILED